MLPKELRIIGLWAKAQLNYRQPKGEKACEELEKITDLDTTQAIFFLTGFCGGPPDNPKEMRRFAKWAEE